VFNGSDKYYSEVYAERAVISHLHHLGWVHLSSFDVQWYSGARRDGGRKGGREGGREEGREGETIGGQEGNREGQREGGRGRE